MQSFCANELTQEFSDLNIKSFNESFISDVIDSNSDHAFTRFITNLFKNLNLETFDAQIAENNTTDGLLFVSYDKLHKAINTLIDFMKRIDANLNTSTMTAINRILALANTVVQVRCDLAQNEGLDVTQRVENLYHTLVVEVTYKLCDLSEEFRDVVIASGFVDCANSYVLSALAALYKCRQILGQIVV